MTSLAFFASAVAQNQNERAPAKGFAVFPAGDTCHTYEFARHAIGDNGIRIEILYAGICHSDLHAAWDEQKEQGLHAANRMIPDTRSPDVLRKSARMSRNSMLAFKRLRKC